MSQREYFKYNADILAYREVDILRMPPNPEGTFGMTSHNKYHTILIYSPDNTI